MRTEFNHSRLLGLMREKGISQEELASMIGVSPSTLNLKLCGKSDFRQSEITAIMSALNVDTGKVGYYFFAI